MTWNDYNSYKQFHIMSELLLCFKSNYYNNFADLAYFVHQFGGSGAQITHIYVAPTGIHKQQDN